MNVPLAAIEPSGDLVTTVTPALAALAAFALFGAATAWSIAVLRGAEGKQRERVTAFGFLVGGALGLVVLAAASIVGS